MTTTLLPQPAATTTSTAVAGRPPPHSAPGVLDRRACNVEELLLAVPDLANNASLRRQGLQQLLNWLQTNPGEDWQQRWDNAHADETVLVWIREGSANQGKVRTAGLNTLLLLRVVHPSYLVFTAFPFKNLYKIAERVSEAEQFRRLHPAVLQTGCSPESAAHAVVVLTRIMLSRRKHLSDINHTDLLHYADVVRSTGRRAVGLHSAYHLLRALGVLDQAVMPATQPRLGQRSPAELVDRYRVRCSPVRDLLVRYLTERSPALDYLSLNTLSAALVQTFWKDLVRHHPDIDSIHLTPEVTTAWKQRLRTLGDGTVRRDTRTIYMAIRSFYLDIAQWALVEPEIWGVWAAPTPITAMEMRGYSKQRRRSTALIKERTRTLSPAVSVLTDSTYQEHRRTQRLCVAAANIPPGGTFSFEDKLYERPLARLTALGEGHRPIRVRLVGAAKDTVDVAKQEQDAFWAWATVEILRLTGIRLEELLELTHFSLQPYVQPDGTTIPLLHIAASKTDTERLIPCGPELATVLAHVIRRAKNGQPRVPVLQRWDPHEHLLAAPLPLLLQRHSPSGPTPITPSYIYGLLKKAIDNASLTGVDGEPLRYQFAPHDFRRIFATETVRSGLPLHIAAKILGHANLETTRGYVAEYDDDVVNTYLDFLDRRRQQRPSAEQRVATSGEWDDYKRHFAERKMALGTCERGYGTPCIHEHACERCAFLRPDPGQRPRLQDMQDNIRCVLSKQSTTAGSANYEACN